MRKPRDFPERTDPIKVESTKQPDMSSQRPSRVCTLVLGSQLCTIGNCRRVKAKVFVELAVAMGQTQLSKYGLLQVANSHHRQYRHLLSGHILEDEW